MGKIRKPTETKNRYASNLKFCTKVFLVIGIKKKDLKVKLLFLTST